MDKLEAIFEAQSKFRKIMGKGQDNILDLMTEQQKGQTLYDLIVAVSSELEELRNTIYWKGWSKEAKDGKRYMFRNVENAKEEIADILCFLGDMCACVGMNAEELAKINIRKTEININRQKTNYGMDTKDGKDSEKLWEEIKTSPVEVTEELPVVDIIELARVGIDRVFRAEIKTKNGVDVQLLNLTHLETMLMNDCSLSSSRELVFRKIGEIIGKFEIGKITFGVA